MLKLNTTTDSSVQYLITVWLQDSENKTAAQVTKTKEDKVKCRWCSGKMKHLHISHAALSADLKHDLKGSNKLLKESKYKILKTH